ncbi:YicC/YloC family endoribonuclease [Gorillibacterium timonense]|uniref:YicC/YloC family endoribonuclease n=1 Tax=Gorillibacterium timonense TaxID=1689269 RepID=UPI00071E653B|nr:YicC/YloC family endoribonuclease [Gorillibacterium timonense]
MIRSMTGFGQALRTGNGYTVRIEMKTVNHRYSEIAIRLPRELLSMEEALKQEVRRLVKRGRTDASITIDRETGDSSAFHVNWEAADRYLAAAEEIARRYGLHSDISVHEILAIPDLLIKREAPETDSDALHELVLDGFGEAAEHLLAMRETEGRHLQEDLQERLAVLRTYRDELAVRAPQIVHGYRERLTMRLRELLDSIPLDEQRVAMEAAIFAERCNVDEELTRLTSHFGQFAELLRSEEPSGRKLDFLIQEMNREINTVGSKAGDAGMAGIVVEMKAELEKIREQVQNIE